MPPFCDCAGTNGKYSCILMLRFNEILERLISADITLMRASNSWSEFERLLDRAYPKHGVVQGELAIEEDQQ